MRLQRYRDKETNEYKTNYKTAHVNLHTHQKSNETKKIVLNSFFFFQQIKVAFFSLARSRTRLVLHGHFYTNTDMSKLKRRHANTHKKKNETNYIMKIIAPKAARCLPMRMNSPSSTFMK